MKVRTLQFGKALSAALFVLLLTVAGTKNTLAQTLVATLQHGNDINFYYGSDALRNAYDAAESGDIITLSSGSFASPNNGIGKAITLRGAGCVTDNTSGVQPTVIDGCYFSVNDAENFFTMEGIRITGETRFDYLCDAKFTKCNFDLFHNQGWGSPQMRNAQFNNCMFNQLNFSCTRNSTLINCVIWRASSLDNDDNSVTAFNSIIKLNSQAYALSAYNCIIIQDYWNDYLRYYSVAYNCIGIKRVYDDEHSVFDVTTFDCVEYDELSDVFETFEGFEDDNFDFTEPFILKSNIATSFLGNDGTEVGLYGGFMPYTSRPSYQIVKHYNVPNKSDAQGHLNVGIELYSGDE